MLRREVLLDVPRREVWRALGDTDGLSAWFGANVTGDVRSGEQVRFRFPDGTERAAAVEEVERERMLAFRWLPFERAPDGATRARLVTRVEFRLEDADVGTRVIIVERDLSTARLAI